MQVPELNFRTNQFGEQYLYEVNRNMFSATGSSSIYKTHYPNTLRVEDALITVIGSDSGLLIKNLIEQGLAAGSHYIFVEPDGLVESIKTVVPELVNTPKVRVCSAEQWSSIAADFNLHDYLYTERCYLIESLGAKENYLPGYIGLRQIMHSQINNQSLHVRAELGSGKFITATLRNVADNMTPAVGLQDIAKGRSAIIMGAGHSAKSILPWLKEHRNTVDLIAVSRVCGLLSDEGVVPDLIISGDPHEFNFEYSQSMLNFSNKSVFLHTNHVSPSLLANWDGKSIFTSERYPWDDLDNATNVKGLGPTIGNTAITLAAFFGYKTLYLAGMDLCVNAEGFAYTQNSGEAITKPSLNATDYAVETYAGAMAETPASYHAAIAYLQQQAEALAKEEITLYQTSLSAAKVEGIDYVDIQQTHAIPQSPDFHVLTSEVLPDYNAKHYQDYLIAARKEIQETVRTLKAIKDLAKDGITSNAKFFGRSGDADPDAKQRMDTIEEQLNGKYKKQTGFIKRFGLREFMSVVKADQSHEYSFEEVEQLTHQYYQAFINTIASITKELDTCLETIATRLEEQKPKPNFKNLFNSWESRDEFGRAAIWCSHFPEQYETLPDGIKKNFTSFEEKLTRKRRDKSDANRRQNEELTSLEAVAVKAREFWLSRSENRLQQLLISMQDKYDDSEDLEHLVKGYIADIHQDYATALEHYEKIKGAEREDALVRIIAIQVHFQKYHDALNTMEALTDYSAFYIPQCAQLNALLGNIQQAIDLYTNYLQYVPNDVHNLMHLATLYQKINLKEGVDVITSHILSLTPEHQPAKQLRDAMELAQRN